MSRASSGTSRPLLAVLLGLAASAVVAGVHLAGWDERAELDALDLRFRHASAPAPDSGLVHVDIDDGSLEKVGRWPWPRAKLAGMLTVLRDCGARSVALDVLLPDPQELRYVAPSGLYDPAPGGGAGGPRLVFDDARLAEAIDATDAALPLVVDLDPPSPSPLRRRAAERLAPQPSLTPEQLAEALDAPAGRVADVYPRALSDAMDRLAAAQFARAGAPPDLEAVVATVLPPELRAGSPQRDAVEQAYLRQRGLRGVERFSVSVEAPRELPGGAITPPLVLFAEAADAAGSVTVVPDVDGVVRHVRPLIRGGGKTYAQFALALALRELRRDGPATLVSSRDALLIRRGRRILRRIRLDDRGRMLVNWLAPPRADGTTPRHIPAAAVVAAHEERRKLARLDGLAHARRMALLRLGVQLGDDERVRDLYWRLNERTEQLDAAYVARVEAQREIQRTALYRPGAQADRERLAELRRRENALEAATWQTSAELVAALRKGDALAAFLGGADADGFAGRFERAGELLKTLDAIPARRRRLAHSVAELTAQVADRVEGRICLIGSTATGAADFVPTPVAARTPGVHVHGRVLETILSGRFIRRAGMWADLAAILACGAVAATVAAFRPILQAAAAAVVLAAGYAALNAWAVFGAWGVWLAAVAPVAAMGASFTAVTVYRELAEQRARRRIRAMFARALSPELVDRLVSDPSLAELGGQRRDVTCLVADLAGFTALSRRLGPRGTVAALNRFFDRLSDVVGARHGGYVNKFLGDGVLCLFGAPVAQADHPARAVRAAVDCLAAVDDLDADGARLSLRVGVACGEAMVGNCGSTDRMDYTAIGDCVNLASRLESANKFFGSHVLVTEKTWQAGGGDDLACRRLGRVRISGVAEPVAVREVIGAAGDLPADRRDALATFAEAIEHFQRRDFAAAAERLERVAAADPNDRAAKVYLSLARAGAADAADADDWPGECVAGDAVVQVAYPRPDGATSDG